MDDKKTLLVAENISKAFPGVQALDKARLSVMKGSVHALVGENGAGKSTLMKCIFGIYHIDEGEILLEGKPVSFESPKQALDNGISMVHQELNQVGRLRVMDNIWLGRFPMKMGLVIDEEKMLKDTQKIFQNLEIEINPLEKVEKLSVSERQMIEIAKAASQNAKVIVMDEPTSSLSEKEVEHLFKVIRKLKNLDCGIIYISHKLEEIFSIADEVTIMRDGKWIATENIKNITIDKVIALMVGRELTHRFPEKTNIVKDVLFSVKNLELVYSPLVKDVSFDLHAGEVLGIAGLDGSMRSEVIEGIFGYRTKSKGNVFLNGKPCKNNNCRNSIKNKFALVTEERKYDGIFSGMSVRNNIVISNLDKYCTKGILSSAKMNKDSGWVVENLNVKTPSEQTKMRTLSGGNQQKIIFGRWLLTQPEVFLLDEPTRGIDVGAKYEIYQLILNLANEGKGVIMISSEMPELLGIADRILVMSNGKVAGVVDAKHTNQEEILRLAAKYL
ncbi:ATP-binding cassette domain-containing protein [uncultured Sphaerochaeta sp.]|uniref:sugar ABC transporter ATP-binding protein n=1 Tax=uncultured Sphaerochaeta sp. TaxID=886478 RepID=UPI002A0A717A|nr:ATP-binding cassette domain-containing protein [uncultured Sphaerochaeta sp.]